MNIGFDLDGIFVHLPPILPAWVIERLYRERNQTQLHYRIPGEIEKRIRILSHASLLRPPIKENILFAKNLSHSKKYTFFLVSSRFGFLKQQTEKIIRKYGIDKIFHKIYFNYDNEQPHIFKDRIIKKMKISLFIDDDIYLLTYLAKENPTTQFFWLNTSTNKKIANNLSAITNISSMTP
ncbi:MAG TPA: hypothetical protein VEW42_06440 [Candidatus Eisenbacteria bacterium]|nr:hypothetical protein [Candidatus Eisenbacteria bacterium]